MKAEEKEGRWSGENPLFEDILSDAFHQDKIGGGRKDGS